MSLNLRVGLVRYLNAKPLYFGLSQQLPEAKFELDLPSRLAVRLAAGELDLALIPSIEFLRGVTRHQYVAMPGCAIATSGPVRSVKLLSHVPLSQIRRLALDEGSRTSQALCRVWLRGVHGVEPELLEELPIGMPAEESTADAVLVIGDRAMRLPEERFHQVIDLGQAWNQWTKLPFVFAVWAARNDSGFDLDILSPILMQCRDNGLIHVESIVSEHAPKLGLGHDETLYYLKNQLSYQLNEPEQAGLRLFAEKAAEMGLLPKGSDLVIHRSGNLAASNSRPTHYL